MTLIILESLIIMTSVTSATLAEAELNWLNRLLQRKTGSFASEKNLTASVQFICRVFTPRMEEFISWCLSRTSVVLPVVAAGIKGLKPLPTYLLDRRLILRISRRIRQIPPVLKRGGPRTRGANAWNAKTRVSLACCCSNCRLCQFVSQHP